MINYVIGAIPKREKEILEKSIEKAAESVIDFHNCAPNGKTFIRINQIHWIKI